MKRSTLLRFIFPVVGLLLTIGSLQISDTIERQPLDADPTLSIIDNCQYNTKGFPLKVTEQAVPLEGSICPPEQTLHATNMAFNWILYLSVLASASILVRTARRIAFGDNTRLLRQRRHASA